MTITLDFEAAKADSSTRRSLSDLSLSVAKCKRIVVVTGAGISCSSGIPDFRSSDGLYALVKQRYPNAVMKGRDLFDASLFRDTTTTSIFYTFISQLKQSIDSASPTPTHCFIKTLDTKKKLLRSYTQNIDGLEERVGLLGSGSQEAKSSSRSKSKIKVKEVRNVQLHGDIHRVRCMSCSAEYPCTSEHLSIFDEGLSPDCPDCIQRSAARVARSARATRVGSLRPAIVLYDEPHPLGDDIGSIQTSDVNRKPDMLIIMGTSLKVHGLKKLVKDFAKAVHAHSSAPSTSSGKAKRWAGKVVFVNKTAPGSEWSDVIDYHVAGETDAWVDKVIEDWKKMRPADWEVQQTLVAIDGDISMASPFRFVKDARVAIGTKAKTKEYKKSRNDDENVPPVPSRDMILSTPDLSGLAITKSLSSPGSPSKRRQGASHYNDNDSSPSKRRIRTNKVGLEPEERGLLFGNSTNQTVGLDDFAEINGSCIADLSMQDLNSPPRPKNVMKARSKMERASKVPLSKTASGDRPQRSQGRLKVEVVIGRNMDIGVACT
ncbi:DHS-like NAD/FAD-binding domain-containing protein [Desarmillaria tabescens]|uniref:DHS-like NAD/FAD-binding domain-containing protein n=1 Tax=Armillaria tabescens TaxID=1929756 RepID=A0AA39TY19_ARMTA|nr:DHS-like NAD/FAD-binding domain-containing protein [Desarmillaria tabescens]KAK0466439.1 DHS-like NAD/FAD-binding domain-containing protein [Desarmillaria tabescens]